MNRYAKNMRALCLFVLTVPLALPLAAQETGAPAAANQRADMRSGVVSPEAQAVLDRMTRTMRGLQAFSIAANATRDEVVAQGYKLQNNESATLVVQRPNKLRVDIAGDIRNRTIVYDGAQVVMYSPDEAAFARTAAPDTLADTLGSLIDLGVEMPMVDVLYQATDGTITENVRGGVLVGQSRINGVDCDHLAFRQGNVDWQLWVERGANALPRKMLITTRYEHGEPQYQATLDWDLKPRIAASTFAFTPPTGATEIPLAKPADAGGGAP